MEGILRLNLSALKFGGPSDQKSSSKMMSTSHVVSHPRIYEGTRGQIQVRIFHKHVGENLNAFYFLQFCPLQIVGWRTGGSFFVFEDISIYFSHNLTH